MINRHVFREYDIRGVAARDFSQPLVEALGAAVGNLVRERMDVERPRIAVGRDARLTGPNLRAWLVEGLVSSGCDVIDVGIVPTPLVYFALFNLDVHGGVMVTGSHNPAPDNGFKICVGRDSLHGADVQRLVTMIEDVPARASARGNVVEVDIHTPYYDRVASDVKLGSRPLRVVVDGGNGPAGAVGAHLLARLGCEVHSLFIELDGHFPNHHPDPTVEDNLVDLQREVARVGADLGVAYDGDGDRVGVIDAEGRIVWGDRLMVVLSRAVLEAVPGATIVGEVKCSQTLFDDIAAHGGRPVMSRVGHSLIKARMKTEHAALAGEMSGHIFFAHRWFGFDDAIYTSARLAEILSRTAAPLSALFAGVPETFVTPEIREDCPDASKFDVVRRLVERFKRTHEVIDIDGARVLFGDGWGLVRASNTQPVLVLRCEARSAQRRDEIRSLLVSAIREVQAEVAS